MSQNINCQSYCFYMMCVSIKQNKYWRIGYVTCQALRFLNTTSYNLLITRKVWAAYLSVALYTHNHLSLPCWEVLENEPCEGHSLGPMALCLPVMFRLWTYWPEIWGQMRGTSAISSLFSPWFCISQAVVIVALQSLFLSKCL